MKFITRALMRLHAEYCVLFWSYEDEKQKNILAEEQKVDWKTA